jgi:hypothetical protein
LYNANGDYIALAGTRFLIIDDINSIENTDFSKAWNPNGFPLVAKANDIVQYDGTRWTVVFASETIDSIKYLTNTATGVQLKWTGSEWVKSYEGLYREGQWRLVL